jgi:uncharacterized FlgJ-related protein
VRTWAPNHLYADMERRFGRDIFTTIFTTNGCRVGARMEHLPTGEVVEVRNLKNAFEAKREAYAQLVHALPKSMAITQALNEELMK